VSGRPVASCRRRECPELLILWKPNPLLQHCVPLCSHVTQHSGHLCSTLAPAIMRARAVGASDVLLGPLPETVTGGATPYRSVRCRALRLRLQHRRRLWRRRRQTGRRRRRPPPSPAPARPTNASGGAADGLQTATERMQGVWVCSSCKASSAGLRCSSGQQNRMIQHQLGCQVNSPPMCTR